MRSLVFCSGGCWTRPPPHRVRGGGGGVRKGREQGRSTRTAEGEGTAEGERTWDAGTRGQHEREEKDTPARRRRLHDATPVARHEGRAHEAAAAVPTTHRVGRALSLSRRSCHSGRGAVGRRVASTGGRGRARPSEIARSLRDGVLGRNARAQGADAVAAAEDGLEEGPVGYILVVKRNNPDVTRHARSYLEEGPVSYILVV